MSRGDKIICFVGPSGSGKTTLVYKLAERYGWNVMESYTTRPPRYAGEKGHVFVGDGPLVFSSNPKASWFDLPKDVIAYTQYNEYEYWSTRDQYQGKGISLYVIDPPGIKMLRNTVKDAEILVIALRADTLTLIRRLYHREGVDTEQDHGRQDAIIDKIDKRMSNDQNAFAVIPCDYSVDVNCSIEMAVELVSKIIKEGVA